MGYHKAEITVVIPVYNVEKYIGRCLNSMLFQTYKDYELILVNDGSSDSSQTICRNYLQMFRQLGIYSEILDQPNSGLSAARNTGIEWALNHSSSRWITFIDSDDWVHPQYLELLYQAVCDYVADVAIGKYDRVQDLCAAFHSHIEDGGKPIDIGDYWTRYRTNATVAWGKLYRKSLFANIRYPIGRYHEDEFVTYRLLFDSKTIVFIDKPIYHYFFNNEGIMNKDFLKRLPDLLFGFSKHIIYFRETEWKQVYRLEIEKYAEALSDGIWILSKNNPGLNKKTIIQLRRKLRSFLKKYRSFISISKRKDIYIAAYPSQSLFIRIFGRLKAKLEARSNEV